MEEEIEEEPPTPNKENEVEAVTGEEFKKDEDYDPNNKACFCFSE